MEPLLTCTLLTLGAPISFAALGVPFCQLPLTRIWVNEPSSTRRSFEPLDTVIEAGRKLLIPICTVGSPPAAVVAVAVHGFTRAAMTIAPLTIPAIPVSVGASQRRFNRSLVR